MIHDLETIYAANLAALREREQKAKKKPLRAALPARIEVLEFIRDNPGCTCKDICKRFNLAIGPFRNISRDLRAFGLVVIKRCCSDSLQSRRYFLTEAGADHD